MKLTENDLKVIQLLKENGRMRYSDLQNRLKISPAGLTKLLTKLTSLKLLKREVEPDRTTYYSLTEEGMRVIEREFVETLKLYSPVLEEEDRKEFEALIEKLKKKYGL